MLRLIAAVAILAALIYFVMGDGEELGEVPVRVECVPGVLKVFVA